ncbi:hypothetical protein [Sinorhizobium fredii]|uniref:hypothetical protein n=1 Tax=Rhizobium fredii TaxID=380 RepID=UPI0035136EB9
MDWGGFIVAVIGPFAAIAVAIFTSSFEKTVIVGQCNRIAIEKNLADGAREVMTKVADSSAVAMSFFPSFVSFTVSLAAILALGPRDVAFIPFVILGVFVAALILVLRPIYILWANSLYDLHNQAPRLFSRENSKVGQSTFLEVIKTSLILFNVVMVIVSALIFGAPWLQSIF